MSAGADKSMLDGTKLDESGLDESKQAGAGGTPGAAIPFPTQERAVPGRMRSFFLEGEAGRLEALVKDGRADAPYAAVVSHPHPKGGGTMHNRVVYHAAKVFERRGWPVLRFNFRGVGLSEGQHDGRAEYGDVSVALDWLRTAYARPIVAAGFSFGAAMGLKAASERWRAGLEDVAGFAALGLPIANGERRYEHPYLADGRFPRLFLSGDHDEYAPVEELRAMVEAAAEPKQFMTVPGADHFFTGHLPEMQEKLRGWLDAFFSGNGAGNGSAHPRGMARDPGQADGKSQDSKIDD